MGLRSAISFGYYANASPQIFEIVGDKYISKAFLFSLLAIIANEQSTWVHFSSNY